MKHEFELFIDIRLEIHQRCHLIGKNANIPTTFADGFRRPKIKDKFVCAHLIRFSL